MAGERESRLERYVLREEAPSAADYARLRAAVGWYPVAPEGVAEGLGRALYSLTLYCDGEVVGCGRVVGDGGIYFYLQDVIVLPEHQGRGLGHRLMERLMDYLERRAPPGAFIGLMAAAGVAAFYERYGFSPRPADRPGMYRVVESPPRL